MAKNKKKSTIFKLVRRNNQPATKGRHYPVSYRIPSIDEIYDEKTGRNRKIQYVLGEQSIYADEQSSFNPVLGDIVFNNGTLPVQYNQVTLREFLETSNYNQANPSRMKDKKAIFETLDLEGDAEKDLEDLETEFHAVETLMSMDAQKMVGYARAMGVNVDRSMYEIKHDMMVIVRKTNWTSIAAPVSKLEPHNLLEKAVRLRPTAPAMLYYFNDMNTNIVNLLQKRKGYVQNIPLTYIYNKYYYFTLLATFLLLSFSSPESCWLEVEDDFGFDTFFSTGSPFNNFLILLKTSLPSVSKV